LTLVLGSLGGIFFARRNIRLGRGDRRNASRLAIFVLILPFMAWVLTWPQVVLVNLLIIPYLGVLTWVLYTAIEPFVRRRWPQMLVSWTRLISGEWRDPLVGRDLLIGVGFGVLGGWLNVVGTLLPLRFISGLDQLSPLVNIANLNGPLFVIGGWLSSIMLGMLISLPTLCFLLILCMLLKHQKAAIAVCVIIIALASGPQFGFEAVLIYAAIMFFVLIRFGFIAMVSVETAAIILIFMPLTLDVSSWYARCSFTAVAIFAAIVLYAFRTSLGGRPIFGTPRLDE
jgi:hypothetical protein